MFYDFEQGRIPVFTTNHTLAFRHHLRLPSRLWLLDKTLAMMEGGALQVDAFLFTCLRQGFAGRLRRRLARSPGSL
jgi:hypothetical protein